MPCGRTVIDVPVGESAVSRVPVPARPFAERIASRTRSAESAPRRADSTAREAVAFGMLTVRALRLAHVEVPSTMRQNTRIGRARDILAQVAATLVPHEMVQKETGRGLRAAD